MHRSSDLLPVSLDIVGIRHQPDPPTDERELSELHRGGRIPLIERQVPSCHRVSGVFPLRAPGRNHAAFPSEASNPLPSRKGKTLGPSKPKTLHMS